MPIALFYDQSGYVETTRTSGVRPEHGPAGLMGREVAGKEFLDALLRHGTWTELAALTTGEAAKQTLAEFCQQHPPSQRQRRRLQCFEAARLHEAGLAAQSIVRLAARSQKDGLRRTIGALRTRQTGPRCISDGVGVSTRRVTTTCHPAPARPEPGR